MRKVDKLKVLVQKYAREIIEEELSNLLFESKRRGLDRELIKDCVREVLAESLGGMGGGSGEERAFTGNSKKRSAIDTLFEQEFTSPRSIKAEAKRSAISAAKGLEGFTREAGHAVPPVEQLTEGQETLVRDAKIINEVKNKFENADLTYLADALMAEPIELRVEDQGDEAADRRMEDIASSMNETWAAVMGTH